jgi:predicted small secreted protein
MKAFSQSKERSMNFKRQEKTLNLVLLAVLVALTLTFTGCNTTEGFGKDMQSAGNSIQHEANSNK